MKYVLKICLAFLNLIFSLLKLFKVQDKVTFISRQADSKSEDMLLLEKSLREKAPDLELVFLCRKLDGGFGRKAGYCFHMLRQMYHIATSKVVVIDSYCIAVSVLKQRKSLVVIQMWHALGSLKKFGLSIVGEGEGSDRQLADLMSMHRNYTYVLTSGEACAANFGEAFGYDESHMKVMSLPRVDKLTDEKLRAAALQKIHEEYPQLKERKVVVYAPTFRKDRDVSAEILALSRAFDSSKYVFVLKRHPLMERCEVSGICDGKFTTLEMLFAADYVICDYSAVIFEAAVMGKPMFFYTFDYDDYGVERDFYIDYRAEMPGVMSPDPKTLAAAVEAENYNLEKVRTFGRRYVYQQKGCSDTLAEFIMDCANANR